MKIILFRQNSSSYPDVSNGKAKKKKKASDNVDVMTETRTERSTAMSSFSKLSSPLDFIGQRYLSYSKERSG